MSAQCTTEVVLPSASGSAAHGNGGEAASTVGVSVQNVGHVFEGRGGRNDVADVRALQDVSLDVAVGTMTAIIGPSGCGKSTLLYIMGGLLRPTEGTAYVDGQPAMKQDRRKVGYMFQEPTLLAWRTTLSNVLLPIQIRHGKKAAEERRDEAIALLRKVGIGDFCNSYAHELSGGMAQRASICRMLITNPSLLLLDEPFGALDELTRDAMDEELEHVVEDLGATSFIVTHSIPEAVYLADTVYVMTPRPGRISDAISVPFPRPRSISITTTAAFAELTGIVRNSLTLAGSREVK
jgi:NitT/TauT family transport system ATP-binding protein